VPDAAQASSLRLLTVMIIAARRGMQAFYRAGGKAAQAAEVDKRIAALPAR